MEHGNRIATAAAQTDRDTITGGGQPCFLLNVLVAQTYRLESQH